MHYIIETKEQLAQIPHLYNPGTYFIEIIPLSDFYHPILSKPCLIYVKSSKLKKGYIICINHSEAMGINIEDISPFFENRLFNESYTTNIKNFIYAGLSTYNLRQIRGKNPNEFNTKTHDAIYKAKYDHLAVNSIIPISKHYEKWENFYNTTVEQSFPWSIVPINELIEVEKNGLGINRDKFDKYFEPTHPQYNIIGNKIYTYYSTDTKTTRPSNSFNGINFASIPKGKPREAFVPINDKFIEFDFDGYHVRLLAELIDDPLAFNMASVHETLGRSYFKKDSLEELTEEEYNMSKQITFKQLYGGFSHDHPFFHKVEKYLKDNHLTHKELSYKIQQRETSRNMSLIREFQRVLKTKKSKLVLYTYDAFLFDIDDYEEDDLVPTIKDVLSNFAYSPLTILGKPKHIFPVKIKHGPNYGALTKY